MENKLHKQSWFFWALGILAVLGSLIQAILFAPSITPAAALFALIGIVAMGISFMVVGSVLRVIGEQAAQVESMKSFMEKELHALRSTRQDPSPAVSTIRVTPGGNDHSSE